MISKYFPVLTRGRRVDRPFVYSWGRRGRGRMAVEFTTTCTISAYYHLSCEFESRSARGVLESTLVCKVCH